MEELDPFVKQLIEQGENERIEFMSDVNIEHLLRTICAMLNNEGGWIVVGINDCKELVDIEDIDDKALQIRKSIAEYIYPSSLIFVKVLDNIILINVLSGSDKPYNYKNVYYTRMDNSVVEASPAFLDTIFKKRQLEERWEETVASNVKVDDLDLYSVNNVIMTGVESGRLKLNFSGKPLEFLSYEHLRDCEKYKFGAFALFGLKTQTLMPQLKFRVQKMLGGITANEYELFAEFQGNLIQLHEQLMIFFEQQLFKGLDFNNISGKNVRSYVLPRNVYDECITNALIHSDYSEFWNEIKLFIYTDRIVCINPGAMPEEVLKRADADTTVSIPRNPIMANILYLNNMMELSGRGLNKIKQTMLEVGCRTPEWEVKDNHTYTTIFTFANESESLRRVKAFHIRHNGAYEFTRAEYQEEMGLQERTSKNDLKLMNEIGLCKLVGKARSAKYILIAR